MHLFKKPDIAVAAKAYKAKELRLCFSTPTVSLQAAAGNIWVGDFKYKENDTPVYVAPHINLTEGAEFISPSAFVTVTSDTSKVNMRVVWQMVDNVHCPWLENPKGVADGERLYRLAGELGVGTCPPKVMERIKKIKEASDEKGKAGEETGQGGRGLRRRKGRRMRRSRGRRPRSPGARRTSEGVSRMTR